MGTLCLQGEQLYANRERENERQICCDGKCRGSLFLMRLYAQNAIRCFKVSDTFVASETHLFITSTGLLRLCRFELIVVMEIPQRLATVSLAVYSQAVKGHQVQFVLHSSHTVSKRNVRKHFLSNTWQRETINYSLSLVIDTSIICRGRKTKII